MYTRFQGVMRTSVHRVYADQVRDIQLLTMPAAVWSNSSLSFHLCRTGAQANWGSVGEAPGAKTSHGATTQRHTRF